MRALRSLILGAALILAASACEMTVRLTTVLDADGGGTFSVGMALDRDALQNFGLIASFTGNRQDGIGSIEDLFDGLEAAGWEVTRTSPDGGVAFEATETFADPDDFGRVLEELRTSRQGGGAVGGSSILLDVQSARSFLTASQGIEGTVDLSLPPELLEVADPDVIAQLRSDLRFEVRAEFEGGIDEVDGPGVTSEGVVVWRPMLGESTTFAASASSLRVGPLLAILLPALLVLGLIGWFAIGRRTKRDPDDGEELRAIVEDAGLDEQAVSANGHAQPSIEVDLTEQPSDPPV